MDDVIVFGKTFTETLFKLTKVFDRFREANLKLKPQKCYLFREELLTYPSYHDMLILDTDASNDEIGAVLSNSKRRRESYCVLQQNSI